MMGGRQPMKMELQMVPNFQIRSGYLFCLLLVGFPSNIIGPYIGPIMYWGYDLKKDHIPKPFVVVIILTRFTISDIIQGIKYTNNLYSSEISGSIDSLLLLKLLNRACSNAIILEANIVLSRSTNKKLGDRSPAKGAF